MKQRITYLVPEGTGIDRDSIIVTDDSLNFTQARGAAVEKRVTVSLSDLPPELNAILRDCHELHIRWISGQVHSYASPLISRLPSGLHAFYTPQKLDKDANLCPLLKKIFGDGIKCKSVADTFSRPPILSERFAAAASYQYFQSQPSIQGMVEYIQNKICASTITPPSKETCNDHASALTQASYIDVDFDTISHALTFTATWPPGIVEPSSRLSGPASRTVKRMSEHTTVEVGVLSTEEVEEPEDVKIGGYLVVLGQDDHPNPVLFSFPSRHHRLPNEDHSSFNASFVQPTGLHPTLSITFPLTTFHPPRDACALHTYLTLPSALFLDRYQLSDADLLKSKNVRALRALSGAEDLEAPDWAVTDWGSASLLELSHPTKSHSGNILDQKWEVQVPLHLRYLQAVPDTPGPSHRSLEVPWPVVFWACEAEDGLKMGTNPFDRVNLGYDGLFGPKTMFYHVPPAGQDLVSTIKVPVLGPDTAPWVPTATWTIVMIGFAWILWSLLSPNRGTKRTATSTKNE